MLNARGKMLGEWAATFDLVFQNSGGAPTFQRGESESWIDLTWASVAIFPGLLKWEVLQKGTLSLHRYVAFQVAPVVPLRELKAKLWRITRKIHLAAFCDCLERGLQGPSSPI